MIGSQATEVVKETYITGERVGKRGEQIHDVAGGKGLNRRGRS